MIEKKNPINFLYCQAEALLGFYNVIIGKKATVRSSAVQVRDKAFVEYKMILQGQRILFLSLNNINI